MRSAFQYSDAGEFLALEVLEAGAAAGGDVAEGGLVEAELSDRSGGVPATDDGQAVDPGQGLGHRAGALGELVDLEHPHRTVPEHRVRIGESLGERRTGLRPDVQAQA